MKLKVLAGAKEGTEIPLKRSKFLIGRSRECTLCAGSDAISRRHCAILTTEDGVSVRDLGSRNGTLVNGAKIDGETPVNVGDTLRVGPLEFEFIPVSVELKTAKKPKVKSVAEAVDRAANQAEVDIEEDEISNWLLGAPNSLSSAGKETMSFRVDETRSTRVRTAPTEDTPVANDAPTEQPADEAGEADDGVQDESGSETESDDKGKKKQRFGKLPSIPKKPSAKDSREAAADILREMSRRR